MIGLFGPCGRESHKIQIKLKVRDPAVSFYFLRIPENGTPVKRHSKTDIASLNEFQQACLKFHFLKKWEKMIPVQIQIKEMPVIFDISFDQTARAKEGQGKGDFFIFKIAYANF